jgi:hypothetical protein
MAVSVPRYTVNDLELFPDDGDRYELLDGILLVTPAPALGLAEVWLVDIADKSVDVWRSRSEHSVMRDVIRWRLPEHDAVLTIDLGEVFAGIE